MSLSPSGLPLSVYIGFSNMASLGFYVLKNCLILVYSSICHTVATRHDRNRDSRHRTDLRVQQSFFVVGNTTVHLEFKNAVYLELIQGCLIGIYWDTESASKALQMNQNLLGCVVQPEGALRPSPNCARLLLFRCLCTLSLNFSSLTFLEPEKSVSQKSMVLPSIAGCNP